MLLAFSHGPVTLCEVGKLDKEVSRENISCGSVVNEGDILPVNVLRLPG